MSSFHLFPVSFAIALLALAPNARAGEVSRFRSKGKVKVSFNKSASKFGKGTSGRGPGREIKPNGAEMAGSVVGAVLTGGVGLMKLRHSATAPYSVKAPIGVEFEAPSTGREGRLTLAFNAQLTLRHWTSYGRGAGAAQNLPRANYESIARYRVIESPTSGRFHLLDGDDHSPVAELELSADGTQLTILRTLSRTAIRASEGLYFEPQNQGEFHWGGNHSNPLVVSPKSPLTFRAESVATQTRKEASRQTASAPTPETTVPRSGVNSAN